MADFDFPALANNDNAITKLNLLISAIKAFLRNIPGSQLRAASVPRDRLEDGSAESYIPMPLGNCTTADRARIAKALGLTQDGGAVSRNIVGWFVYCDAAATVAAGDQIILKRGATYGAASTIITIDLNQANLTNNEPIGNTDLQTWANAQNLYADYNYNGAGASSYPNLTLVLVIEAPHAAT